MYLTLQLPINKKFKGTIYFVPLDLSKPRIKVVYQMNKDSTIRQLKQHIGQILSVDPNRVQSYIPYFYSFSTVNHLFFNVLSADGCR
jgi:ubiquitin carboxyl-terminal hydrolase 4/11/15